MNLIDLLARLHQAAPEMCRIQIIADNPHYIIDEYYFWFQGKELRASALKVCCAEGRPALDWLTGALTAECERRKWIYDISRSENRQGEFYYEVTIHNKWNSLPKEANTLAEALLTALVAAMEAEREK